MDVLIMVTCAWHAAGPHDGELAVLRARVAELEARLAERDAQLEAAQARLEVLAGQAEMLRRRLGRDSATSSKPPSSDSPYQKKPKDRSLRQPTLSVRTSARPPPCPNACKNSSVSTSPPHISASSTANTPANGSQNSNSQ